MLMITAFFSIAAVRLHAAEHGVPTDFPTIQTALDSVSAGDVIVVEPGNYAEELQWPATQDISLTSRLGAESTILTGLNDFRVLTLVGPLGRGTRIEGFTVQDGLHYVGGSTDAHGGGIYLLGASVTIQQCVIRNCRAYGRSRSSMAYGGGIDAWFCSPVITGCLIENNRAESWYGVGAWGGGIYLSYGPDMAQITNNVVRSNVSDSGCDGITIDGTAYVANNVIYGNGWDGLISWSNSSIIINNSIGYHARTALASVWHFSSLFNNVVVGGRFGIHGNGLPTAAGWNISWGSEHNYYETEVGMNDLQADPRWNLSFHLLADSPAIDTGMNSGAKTDIDDQRRPSGLAYDRGADEFVAAVSAPPVKELRAESSSAVGELLRHLPRNAAAHNRVVKDACHVPDDFPTIQAALNDGCRSILVQPGIYFENIDFGQSNYDTQIQSVEGPGATIIDGGQRGRVITIQDPNADIIEISGFTIRNGYASDTGGAGILMTQDFISIRNCIFEDNIVECESGGCYGGAVLIADDCYEPKIESCQFRRNRVAGIADCSGGAIGVVNSKYLGFYYFNAVVEVFRCAFDGNQAGERGGAIYSESPCALLGCVLTGNEPGAVFAASDGASLINNTMVQNCQYAFTSCGSLPGVALNNIIAGHTVGLDTSDLITAHNVFWQNQTDVEGGEYGTGDMNADPQLSGDFAPYSGSPCIDAGITANISSDLAGQPRPLGSAIDIGAVEHDPANPPPSPTMTANPTESPPPSASPTPIPSATRQPSPAMTETPTALPTAKSCDELGVSLWMPASRYAPGDPCSCRALVCNPLSRPIEGLPLFVLLDVHGEYYFGPGFTSEVESYLPLNPRYPVGETMVVIVPEFSWPEDAGSAAGIWWRAALTDAEITRIEGKSAAWEFGWGP